MTRVFSIVVCTFWAAASVFGADPVAEGGSLPFAVDLREAVAAEGLPLMLTDESAEETSEAFLVDMRTVVESNSQLVEGGEVLSVAEGAAAFELDLREATASADEGLRLVGEPAESESDGFELDLREAVGSVPLEEPMGETAEGESGFSMDLREVTALAEDGGAVVWGEVAEGEAGFELDLREVQASAPSVTEPVVGEAAGSAAFELDLRTVEPDGRAGAVLTDIVSLESVSLPFELDLRNVKAGDGYFRIGTAVTVASGRFELDLREVAEPGADGSSVLPSAMTVEAEIGGFELDLRSVEAETDEDGQAAELVRYVDEKGVEKTVLVPHDWIRENVPQASDFAAALKLTAANGRNSVWQCYVAGLDPQDETSEFKADIKVLADGSVEIDWSPKLSPEEAARRVYTTLGAARLGDDFKPIEEFGEDEPKPQFFRVQVEMR